MQKLVQKFNVNHSVHLSRQERTYMQASKSYLADKVCTFYMLCFLLDKILWDEFSLKANVWNQFTSQNKKKIKSRHHLIYLSN